MMVVAGSVGLAASMMDDTGITGSDLLSMTINLIYDSCWLLDNWYLAIGHKPIKNIVDRPKPNTKSIVLTSSRSNALLASLLVHEECERWNRILEWHLVIGHDKKISVDDPNQTLTQKILTSKLEVNSLRRCKHWNRILKWHGVISPSWIPIAEVMRRSLNPSLNIDEWIMIWEAIPTHIIIWTMCNVIGVCDTPPLANL